MHLAIDASRSTRPYPTGTERYALELIRALIPRSSGHRVTLYFRDPPPADLFPAAQHVAQVVLPQRRLWTHTRFARALYRDRPDMTFVPAHTLPFVMPGRAAVTVHDLGYLHFPQAHPGRSRRYLDLTTRHSARRATIVLADSQATADDLNAFYSVTPDKIRVVYPGVTAPPEGDRAAVRLKFALPERYFVFIGTLQPRKNIARLAQAFAQVYAQQRDVALVLAGAKGWLYDPAWAEGVPGVRLLGYVSDEDKGALLAGSVALTFPSLHEGFGFPVVEAMHAGTAVITSATSSLPELAGDAGLLVDPEDVDAIAAAMLRVLNDDALRADLVARGRQQAARFTWDACADAALAALLEAAS